MNSEVSNTGGYLVYLTHVSTAASAGFRETTACPTALSSVIRDQVVNAQPFVIEQPPAVVPPRLVFVNVPC